MKISSKLMREAHRLTKEIKNEYPEVNYSFQLGICIKFLAKEGAKMIGTEKQILWAEDIKSELFKAFEIIDLMREDEKIKESEIAMEVLGLLDSFKKDVECQDSAKWFIDNRAVVSKCNVGGIDKNILNYSLVMDIMKKYKYQYTSVAQKMAKKVKSKFFV